MKAPLAHSGRSSEFSPARHDVNRAMLEGGEHVVEQARVGVETNVANCGCAGPAGVEKDQHPTELRDLGDLLPQSPDIQGRRLQCCRSIGVGVVGDEVKCLFIQTSMAGEQDDRGVTALALTHAVTHAL